MGRERETERAKACHKNGLIQADTAARSPPSSLAPGFAAAQKSFAHPSKTFTEMRLFTWPTTAASWMYIECVGVVIQPQTYSITRRNRDFGRQEICGACRTEILFVMLCSFYSRYSFIKHLRKTWDLRLECFRQSHENSKYTIFVESAKKQMLFINVLDGV